MKKTSSAKYPVDDPRDVTNYVQHGYHAFVGCNDPNQYASFVETLQIALDGRIQGCIFCSDISSLRGFAVNVVEACQNLVAALGAPSLNRALGIASSLEEAMEVYSKNSRQGYLILGNMDQVIGMQRTIEIEGPLRSVMQLRDDIAIVIVASNETIDGLVGDYHRPFYRSFRVFRL